MKTILKKVWPYLVIALLCVALWESNSRAIQYHRLSNTFENTISDLNQQIKHTQIRLNDSIALYQAEVKNLSYSKNNLKAKYDKLLKASKLKPKDVGSVTEIVTVVHEVDTVIAEADTFGGITARLHDPFVSIDVEVKSDLKTLIDYEVRDSLTVITVQKKHSWLFGLIKWKEHKSTRVINHNPKATIADLKTIDILE